jgi:hypothetical protein
MKSGLWILLIVSTGACFSGASSSLPVVDFRYANHNVQTPIGIRDGRRSPLVLQDGSIRIDQWLLEVELLEAQGNKPTIHGDWQQELVDGYLPMVQTRARGDGLQIQKTAFTAESSQGACDVLQVELLNPKRSGQEVQFAVRFGPGSARVTESGLTMEATRGIAAYLSKEWCQGLSRTAVRVRKPVLGYVGSRNVLRNWASPADGVIEAFRDAAVGWNRRPIQFRFPAQSDQVYTVVLGLCEGYWDVPGKRLLDLQVEGDKPLTVDPVELSGENKPMLLQFLGRDRNRDGAVDITVAANRDSPDRNAVLNAIWVFEGPPTVEMMGTNLLTAEHDHSALYHVACGKPDVQMAGGSDGLIRLSVPSFGRASFTLILPWQDQNDPACLHTDPGELFERTRSRWSAFLDRGTDISVPDRVVIDFYRACLAQLFLLRDREGDGFAPRTRRIRPSRGTLRDQAYTSVALSTAGYGWAARECLAALRSRQKPDGEWADPPLQWDGAGQAIWAMWTEGQLSESDSYFRSLYPTIAAGCEWITRSRQTEVQRFSDRKAGIYGLLPPGTAPGGGPRQHYYGHNFWSLLGLRLAADIAERIGEVEDARRWRSEHRRYRRDLGRSVERAFLQDRGYLPSAPDGAGGWFLWGSLSAIYPWGEFAGSAELQSTIDRIGARFQNGLPVGLGREPRTTCLAGSVDLAGCYLTLGEWEKVPSLLYALLNHAHRTKTWAEEISLTGRDGLGDVPHVGAAAAYLILLRQTVLWEEERDLHLAAATHRAWLNPGCTISLADAPSLFGQITFYLQRISRDTLLGALTIPKQKQRLKVHIHLRLPDNCRAKEAILNGGRVPVRGEEIVFSSSGGVYDLHVDIEPL